MAQIQLYCKQTFTENVKVYTINRDSDAETVLRNLDQWILQDFGLQQFEYVDGSYSFKHPEYRGYSEHAPKMDFSDFTELLQRREDFHVIYIRTVSIEQCGICFEDNESSTMRVNFLCTHRFCRTCVVTMTNANHRSCPICRASVIPRATVTIGAVV